jgi:hypothetical protein
MPSLAQTIFISQSALRQVHSQIRSEFSTQCDLVLLLPIYCILYFPQGHPVAAYFFFLVFPPLLPPIFPSITCFRMQFLRNILKLYNVEYFEMVVNNCVGQHNVRSVPKFAGTALHKTRKLCQDSLWPKQESKQ